MPFPHILYLWVSLVSTTLPLDFMYHLVQSSGIPISLSHSLGVKRLILVDSGEYSRCSWVMPVVRQFAIPSSRGCSSLPRLGLQSLPVAFRCAFRIFLLSSVLRSVNA